MTLAFFNYGLPVLLGYTLFVGISGRLNPFARPYYREERASHLLGIWTGLTVSLVLAFALRLAYDMPVDAAKALLLPVASLIAALLAPALALYAYYQYRSSRTATQAAQSSFNWAMAEADLQEITEFNRGQLSACTLDITLDETGAVHDTHVNDNLKEVSPTYLETVKIDRMAIAAGLEAVNDSGSDNAKLDELSTDLDAHNDTFNPCVSEDRTLHANQESDEDLRKKLNAEIVLREQIETHLRITRKALSVMEAETRHQSMDKADAIIELEEKLASSIDKSADSESEIMRERAHRLELEQDVVALKHKLVKARQDIRRSAAARAGALSTANKSIAFARQSVEIRTRLEQELEDAQNTVGNRQKTISSLIRALEKEKRKTQSDVNSMARQLVLHERQLKARRTLEEVARSVENKLASRLVKKVAKARPLASNMNQGEAN